jgi:hypothetical protein
MGLCSQRRIAPVTSVLAVLVTAIHVFAEEDMDARVKPAHDESWRL